MTITRKDLLLEIGCEELPTNAVKTLKEKLSRILVEQLESAQLMASHSRVSTFATPRRIAVLLSDIADKQEPQTIERQGPHENAAFDKSGKPTPAAIGFAEACSISVEQLTVKETPKGKFLYFSGQRPGRLTIELLPELIALALRKIPIDRPMRWGSHAESFARPVHWILILFGEQAVTAKIFNLTSSNKSYGHRFHHPETVLITTPQSYSEKLKEAKVIASFEERRELIQKNIQLALPNGNQLGWDDELLNEVTALVEWPVVLLGEFNPDYLKIPPEVLITSMKTNQKYFPVFDQLGKLQPKFVLISNIESKDPKAVIQGNERVLNARLADAAFFYKNDLQQSLESRLPHLEHVIFQKQLGSMAHKTERLVNLSEYIAMKIGAEVKIAKQAAQLCKCDLLSEMVNEFPTLQGVMGCYYADNDGLSSSAALSIKEHYYPRFSADVLPNSKEGITVALADKVDTLVGIFGINQAPTGDKDPFALRRTANGVLQILIEKNIHLDLEQLLEHAKKTYASHLPNSALISQVFDFVMHRLRSFCLDKEFSPQQFEAVLAKKPTDLLNFMQRLEAVRKFQQLPEATALASADKRVRNILRKQEQDLSKSSLDPSLFDQDAEKQLAAKLSIQDKKMNELYKAGQYIQALEELASLKESVDLFLIK